MNEKEERDFQLERERERIFKGEKKRERGRFKEAVGDLSGKMEKRKE